MNASKVLTLLKERRDHDNEVYFSKMQPEVRQAMLK